MVDMPKWELWTTNMRDTNFFVQSTWGQAWFTCIWPSAFAFSNLAKIGCCSLLRDTVTVSCHSTMFFFYYFLLLFASFVLVYTHLFSILSFSFCCICFLLFAFWFCFLIFCICRSWFFRGCVLPFRHVCHLFYGCIY